MSASHYRWFAAGDVNAFFGLSLDNLANLLLAVSLLERGFGFPEDFAVRYMIPGTALGVLLGDLANSWLAFRLARRTGNPTVTAMPLGLDTPSTFGMVLFVLGPAFLAAKERLGDAELAARHAWHIGICALVVSGLFKLGCSFAAHRVRQAIPRAGLLGSLAAVALVLISFFPTLQIIQSPIVGFASLAVVLATLTARLSLPFRLPGALGALLVGGLLYTLLRWTGLLVSSDSDVAVQQVVAGGWTEALRFEWTAQFRESLAYVPVLIPFALATVIGGIDCTESAAAAGNEYPTGLIVGIEALATLFAGLMGGVIQTTPYIGHPAYQAMGGRSAYTIATGLLLGVVGCFGLFGTLYQWLPREAIVPILVFVGLEITSQSYLATPRQYYPAVALACVPALGELVRLFTDPLLVEQGLDLAQLGGETARNLQTLRILGHGFIVTALVWSSTLAATIDGRLIRAAAFLGAGGVGTLFGIMHSPLPGSPLFWPWNLPALPSAALGQTPGYIAAGYFAAATVLLGLSLVAVRPCSTAVSTDRDAP